VFSFNLSGALQNKFKANYTFVDNWSPFSNADEAINAYYINKSETWSFHDEFPFA
jgi:hypothetical protein